MPEKAELVIITGISGAGHSTTLNIMEDIGFDAIDNLPVNLLNPLIKEKASNPFRLAVGIDLRTQGIMGKKFLDELQAIRALPYMKTTVLFLECTDEVLLRRFSVTRRRHPLGTDQRISASIARERTLLRGLKDISDETIDTTDLTHATLKKMLTARFSHFDQIPVITIMSFSYKNGLPAEADLVFDTRFLRNPFYQESLKEYDGRHPGVAAYIAQDDLYQPFISAFQPMIKLLIDGYKQEGKAYLTLAFGCTGGRHRSVFIAEKTAEWLMQSGWLVTIYHREI